MRLRTLLSLLLPAVVVWLTPGVAHAKIAPSSATIDGEQLAGPLNIDPSSGPGGSGDHFYRLVEQAGFFAATMALVPDQMLDERPTSDLGPMLEISWRVDDHEAAAAGAGGTVVQLVYPDADGGPLTYTEPGQEVVDGVTAPGGWYRAPAAIAGSLDALGVPVDDLAGPPASAPAKPTDGRSGSTWVPAGAATAAAVLGAGAVLLSRRRARMRFTTT
jgi:hypothetical protein